MTFCQTVEKMQPCHRPCKMPLQSVRRVSGTMRIAIRHGGHKYATCEATFEAKAADESRAGAGGRRVVFIANRGRIRSDRRAAGGYADDAQQCTESRNHAR